MIINYQLKLTFNNGVEGIVNLEQELYGGIFESLKDKVLFQQVFVNSRTVEWPNGADFAPEFLLGIVLNNLLVLTVLVPIAASKSLAIAR